MGQIREKKRYLKDVDVNRFIRFVLKVQGKERKPKKILTWFLKRFKR